MSQAASKSTAAEVLIAGKWRPANSSKTFHAYHPETGEQLARSFPISSWADCDEALTAAVRAARSLRTTPVERISQFLQSYADGIAARRDELVEIAFQETALPRSPRLADVELPRTTNQLRLAAAAANDQSWRAAVIDTKAGIRSSLAAIGPVCVFGPNNFPFAFGSASGGDFAAAIAAGNPVIAKANSSHPGTTELFAQIAHEAVTAAGLHPATVQLLYRLDHADGERLVSDPRIGATGYTGSRSAGLKLKAAADAHGKPIYLELSSVNPVVLLPGAVRERQDALVQEFVTSGLMGTGQFCTNPGVVILLEGEDSETFMASVVSKYAESGNGPLLSAGVQSSLSDNVQKLIGAGATSLVGAGQSTTPGYRCQNTVLRVSGRQFLEAPETFQTETFGNASLFVVASSTDEINRIFETLEGNLTGCIYSHSDGSDDPAYDQIVDALRQRVGRLLNDKMPTGVAVSPAMNHGGPFPSTGHPGFTAVGIPAAMIRFAMLQCFDNVRPHRLPAYLQDANPNGTMWRNIDGAWTQQSVPSA